MTKTVRNTAAAAEEAFHKHYAAIWGEERWKTTLYPALCEPTRYCALANRYAPVLETHEILSRPLAEHNAELASLQFPHLQLDTEGSEASNSSSSLRCSVYQPTSNADETSPGLPNTYPPPQPSVSHAAHRMTHWNLDAASALVAHLLHVKPGDSVLDLCAAPGGKSVALAQGIWPNLYADMPLSNASGNGRLVSNEADVKRSKRLVENLESYAPVQVIKSGALKCTRVDASQPTSALNALIAGGGAFDKVLVDAPCSSERHMIHAHLKAQSTGSSAPEMANWRPGSSKRLAKTQVELLMTALKAVKMGGVVMYATCSIEPTENDDVIEKMLALVEKERKRGVKWTAELGFRRVYDNGNIETQLERWAERTKYGWMVLPDHPGQGKWGPLFFAPMKKTGFG